MESVKGLVSIIIPVYNGERYLARCIDSVLGQSYGNFELILADDGSPDGSLGICEDYASKDSRIIVVSNENHGGSYTRNCGIERAAGEFIVFIDCDDHVDKDYVKNLVSLMSSDVDIGITGWRKERENGDLIERCVSINGVLEVGQCLSKTVSLNAFQGYPVSKIFRADILKDNGIRFDREITIFEDLLFCCTYVKCCRKAAVNTDLCDYHYVIRESSSRNAAIHSESFDLNWLTEIKSLEKLLETVSGFSDARKRVRARIALSSSFYINRMFDCSYEDKALQDDLRSRIKKNLAPVMFSPEGNIKWKMQAFLCAVSPRFEYRLKSR